MSSKSLINNNEESSPTNKSRPETPNEYSRKDSQQKNTKKFPSNTNLTLTQDKDLLEKINEHIKETKEKDQSIETLNNKIKEQQTEIEKLNSTFEARVDKIKNECRKELDKKDKSLKSVSETNKKLLENLEVLNNEMDHQLDKSSMFKKAELKMKSHGMKAEKPLEILVKVKEKELHNMNNMIGWVKREKELLEKERDEKILNPFAIVELQDKLKFEEKKVQDLQNELKTFQRLKNNDDAKKLEEMKLLWEKERKMLKEEIHMFKEKTKSHNVKQREDESARNSVLNARYIEEEINRKKFEQEVENFKNVIHMIRSEHPDISTSVDDIQLRIEKEKERLLEEKQKEKEKAQLESEKESGDGAVNLKSTKNKYSSSKNTHKRNVSQSQEINYKKFKKMKNNSSYSSLNLSSHRSNSKTHKLDQSKPELKIFNDEEKSILEKKITKEEVDRFEKRFIALEHAKISNDNKAKLDIKGYLKIIQENTEQLDYLNLQFKESEQKNKILQHQINEAKLETRLTTKKGNEFTQNIEYLSKMLKEKEQENKILLHKFNAIKRLTKHNTLAPLGIKTDYVPETEQMGSHENLEQMSHRSETNIEIVETSPVNSPEKAQNNSSIEMNEDNAKNSTDKPKSDNEVKADVVASPTDKSSKEVKEVKGGKGKATNKKK